MSTNYIENVMDDLDEAECIGTCQNYKYCKATSTKNEHAKIVKFFAWLNESYATFHSQIIMKIFVHDLAEIYNLLVHDHNQQNIAMVSTNSSSFNITITPSDQIDVNATWSSYRITCLYVLDISTLMDSSTPISPSCSAIFVDAILWHSRLRHPSYDKVDVLNNVLGLHKRNKEDLVHCSTCQLAKHKNLSFPSHNNMSKVAFALCILTLGDHLQFQLLKVIDIFLL